MKSKYMTMKTKLQRRLYYSNKYSFLKSVIFLFFFINSITLIQAQSVLDTDIDFSINTIREINDTVFFTTEKGVYYNNGNKLKLYFSDFEIDREIKFTNEIFDIIKFHDNIYCFTSNSIININSKKKTNILIKDHKFIKTACVSNNFLYVALSEKYIYKYKEQNNRLQIIDTFIIDNKDINAMFCDTKNTVWIASNSGLFKIIFSNVEKIEGINEPVFCINQNKDDLFFGGSGIYWKKPKGEMFFLETTLCFDNNIKQIDFGKNNQMWFASEKVSGIIVDENKQKYNIIADTIAGLQSNYTTSIYAFKNKDSVYVGTEGKGVFVFNLKDLIITDTCSAILPCEEEQTPGVGTSKPKTHVLSETGEFRVFWNMYGVPDKLIVYEGRKAKIEKILFETDFVINAGKSKKIFSNERYITIKIIGNDGNKTTKWDYRIDCIEN